MDNYWDLDEKTRAALDEDQVQQLANFELMRLGVLKVAPFVETPVPVLPEPTRQVFKLRRREFSSLAGDPGVVFESAEAAAAFLATSPIVMASEWMHNDTREHVGALGACEIVAVKVYTTAEFNEHKASIRKASEIKQANQKAQRAQDEALSGMWTDWTDCCRKSERLQRVVDTFAEYVRLAGNEETAARFLAKAFPADTITDAAEWFGNQALTATVQAA